MMIKSGVCWSRVIAFVVLGLIAAVPIASAQTVLTACQPLPTGNYALGKNITASGDCFTITGNNVAIDFKGHTLTGNGSGNGVTDGDVFFSNTVISNGTIANFANGINLADSGDATINHMNVSHNSGFGVTILRCCNTINSVKAEHNGSGGIFIDSCCNTVTGSQALNNGGEGIATNECCSIVNGSTASNNATHGISMGGGKNFAAGDTAHGNGGEGIAMDQSDNMLINSTVTNSGSTGVELDGIENFVVGSKSNDNVGTGFNLNDDNGDQITSSQANGNHGAGVSISCPGAVLLLSAKGNTLGNLVTSGGTCTEIDNKTP